MPEFAEFGTRLARFARVVLLDRRGTGLSDPIVGAPTLEERMDDVRAVMDAVGWQRAAVSGAGKVEHLLCNGVTASGVRRRATHTRDARTAFREQLECR